MLKEFRQFVMRGNVVDLAVAVVIGTAFGAVVTALVADLITPLVAAIFGKPSLASLSFEINNSRFLYGAFLNAVLAFLVVAAAIFFFVVKPLNVFAARRAAREPDEPATTRDCPECLSEIPIAAHRCAYCTSAVPAAGAA
jgi:large conductance mechanosensitive channel